MGGRSNLLMVLVLSIGVLVAAVPPAVYVDKWHIRVVNGLSNGILFAHCKSRDNDIGEQNIKPGDDIEWSFKENTWATTLFWCFLRKPNNASASFEVFWHETEHYWLHYRCTIAGTCNWIARDDGVYLKNIPDNLEDLVHKWGP